MPPRALVTAILEDVLDPEGVGNLDAACLEGATDDMFGRMRGMPRYMGTGIVALTFLYGGRGYTRLPKGRRVARLEAWRVAPISFFRDFVEFWEKMGTFVYYSRVEHAGIGPAARDGAA